MQELCDGQNEMCSGGDAHQPAGCCCGGRAAKHQILQAHHGHVWHGPKVHFGYYWYDWGWRWGGSRRTWYGSYFSPAPPWW